MRGAKRAILHLWRRKGQSAVMLSVLTLICTMLLLSTLFVRATQRSIRDLQDRLMASFALARDTTNEELFDNSVAPDNYDAYYTGPQLDEALLEYILSVDGVTDFNWERELSLNSFLLMDLQLVPGENARALETGDYVQSYSQGGLLKVDRLQQLYSTTFDVNTNTALNRYFTSGQFSLTQGRHIASEDASKAMICKDVADRNNLAVGDTFQIAVTAWNTLDVDMQTRESLTQEDFERLRQTCVKGPYTLEIVGIYDVMLPSTGRFDGVDAEHLMPENQILVDWTTGRTMMQDRVDVGAGGVLDQHLYQQMAFRVEDPALLEAIMQQIQQEQPQTRLFAWQTNAGTYTASVAPLAWLGNMMRVAAFAIAVLGIVLLLLVCLLWNRERLRETAICIAAGVPKRSMVCQMLLESSILVLIAAVISVAPAFWAGQKVEEEFLTYAAQESGQEELLVEDYDRYAQVTSFDAWKMFVTYRNMTPEKLELELTPALFIAQLCVMLAVAAAAILFANAWILRMKPKTLLACAA